MADTQSCRNRVFCYICLLCLCSSAHLYCRTPLIPACPQHALFPQDTLVLMVPYLSLFSLFPLPIPSSISLWYNMCQLSDRARDLSVLLTFSLFKSSQMRKPFYLLVWNRIFNEKNIQDQEYYESWFHEYWNKVCQLAYAAAQIDFIHLQKWLILDVVHLYEFCYKASNTLSVCQSCSSLDWPVKSPVSGAHGGPDTCSHTQYFTHAVTLRMCHAGFTPDRKTLQERAIMCQLLA